MNNYLYYGILGLFVLINFLLGGNSWTAGLIIAGSALAQHDARIDCQRQIDEAIEIILDDLLEQKRSTTSVSEFRELLSLQKEWEAYWFIVAGREENECVLDWLEGKW